MISAKTSLVVLAVAGMGLAGCTNPDGTRNNAATGAAAGAVAGGLLGRVIGDDTKSTVIGTAIGATAGAVIGNQLDRQQQALQRDIGASGAGIVNTGDRLIVSLPEAITFAVDSATVRADIQDDIFAIANNLQQFPNNTVQVIGHTDNTGSDAYNQSLSDRRAAAVANILYSGGVPRARVVAFGVGESQPAASNATAAGRQQNRRVEIIITPTG